MNHHIRSHLTYQISSLFNTLSCPAPLQFPLRPMFLPCSVDSLTRHTFLLPVKPGWRLNVWVAAVRQRGGGDLGQHGGKALYCWKSPLWPSFPLVCPVSRPSERWHWSQPGVQENPHTYWTSRFSQEWFYHKTEMTRRICFKVWFISKVRTKQSGYLK